MGGPKQAVQNGQSKTGGPKRAVQNGRSKTGGPKQAVQNGRSKTGGGGPKRSVKKKFRDLEKTLEPTADRVHTGTRAHYTFPQSEISSCNSMVKSNTRPGFTIIYGSSKDEREEDETASTR